MASLTEDEARSLCLHHMNAHGLLEKGWKFGWVNRKTAMGLCNGKKKKIFLSKFFLSRVAGTTTLNTILHEIAHALDFEARGKSDHSPQWKAIAARIGAKPERVSQAPIDWRRPYVIKFNNEIVYSWDKLPTNWRERMKAMYVKGRKEETLGKLKLFKVTYKPVD